MTRDRHLPGYARPIPYRALLSSEPAAAAADVQPEGPPPDAATLTRLSGQGRIVTASPLYCEYWRSSAEINSIGRVLIAFEPRQRRFVVWSDCAFWPQPEDERTATLLYAGADPARAWQAADEAAEWLFRRVQQGGGDVLLGEEGWPHLRAPGTRALLEQLARQARLPAPPRRLRDLLGGR